MIKIICSSSVFLRLGIEKKSNCFIWFKHLWINTKNCLWFVCVSVRYQSRYLSVVALKTKIFDKTQLRSACVKRRFGERPRSLSSVFVQAEWVFSVSPSLSLPLCGRLFPPSLSPSRSHSGALPLCAPPAPISTGFVAACGAAHSVPCPGAHARTPRACTCIGLQ